jgi:hypothetical protein
MVFIQVWKVTPFSRHVWRRWSVKHFVRDIPERVKRGLAPIGE